MWFFKKMCLLRAKSSRRDSNSKSLNCYPIPYDSCSADRPRRRAVLCAVSYKQWRSYVLEGTINDVTSMKDLLLTRFGYRSDNIVVLTEEEADERLVPTKSNIEKALIWLVEGSREGDRLVFYFSGHGLRVLDFNADEVDGFDEAIFPVDFLTKGAIVDNDIYKAIVEPLKKGVTLHAIVDACHSGTILDLENLYDKHGRKWIDNKPPSGASKQTSGGLAISISACEDSQVAADTTVFSREMNGALTFLLKQVLRAKPRITYGDLLDRMYDGIEEANNIGCCSHRQPKIFRQVCGDNITQKPQLSSSMQFDIYEKEFEL